MNAKPNDSINPPALGAPLINLVACDEVDTIVGRRVDSGVGPLRVTTEVEMNVTEQWAESCPRPPNSLRLAYRLLPSGKTLWPHGTDKDKPSVNTLVNP